MSALGSFVRYGSNEKLHAFDKHQNMVMAFGSPVVTRYFTLEELQEFIVTIEKAIDEEPNFIQRMGLQRILCVLMASLDQIRQNHEAFVEEAPCGEDLEEYMFEFARAAAMLPAAKEG